MARGRRPRRTRRGWGALRKLPSGRYQASYIGPDLRRHTAPYTFETSLDAEGWLVAERRLILADTWTPPRTRDRRRRAAGLTLAEWAPQALERRRTPKGEKLRPGTRELYGKLLRTAILPDLGHYTLTQITPDLVSAWFDRLDPEKPTRRAHAYSLLRTCMEQAIDDDKHPGPNPCQIRGAGKVDRAREIRTASLAEIVTIAEGMPERLRMLVLLAAWCGLRFGELAELRRSDIDLVRGVVHVRRAVVRVDGCDLVGPPKSAAGVRAIAIPPHLLPAVDDHLRTHVGAAPDSLAFPGRAEGEHLAHGELMTAFSAAREAAGRPDLRLHDLRHTAATMAAQTGATLAELMARLGHSTPGAALRYQHAAQARDAEIAARLSQMAEGR